MKISKFRTIWIIFVSILYTANTCCRAIVKRFFGVITREWVDSELHSWINRLLAIIDVNCIVINPYNTQPVPGNPTILMCNHSSLYDIPIGFKAFPNQSIRMLAKKELASLPLLGKGMKASEFLFIDRKNRRQAIKDLIKVQELMKSGVVMWIFPEGTRSEDGKLAPFKKGAFITAINAKATIIPIGIRGAFTILPAHSTQFNINQTAEIHIGKPIDAACYTTTNKEELMAEVWQAIKKLMG